MMKKILARLVFLMLGAASSFAQAQLMPQPPEVAARAYLLIDITANQVLAGKDAQMPVEPASLTKLMTAYLVFDALKLKKINLQQTLPVSVNAWKQPGSRMFIDPKMSVPVEDLIKGMIVQSGNDATMALAEGVGGTAERFVQMMNEQAKALGMSATQFKNPSGLPEAGHITTARDLSVLATRLMRDHADFVAYYAIKKYHYPGTPKANDSNRNVLLFRDPSVDGLKTGHTDAAGYCLIATARRDFDNLTPAGAAPGASAAGGGRRLLAIVLGADSENARANEAQKLLNWGFSAFEAVKLFEANQAAVSPAVWKGKDNRVNLGSSQAIVVAVPAGSAAKLVTRVVRPDPLKAPLIKGQTVGSLKVSVGEQALVDIPLQVLNTVDEAGVLGRAWDAMRLWIR